MCNVCFPNQEVIFVSQRKYLVFSSKENNPNEKNNIIKAITLVEILGGFFPMPKGNFESNNN